MIIEQAAGSKQCLPRRGLPRRNPKQNLPRRGSVRASAEALMAADKTFCPDQMAARMSGKWRA